MVISLWARGAAVAAAAVALAALPGTAQAESGCGARYTVQPGDTLAAIAGRCGTTVEALAEANDEVADPARISVGWELTIPGALPNADPGPDPAADPSAAASLGPEAEVRPPIRDAAAEAALADGTYEVRAGDSFASIATALRVPMHELMAANETVNPFALRPGQTLHLPAGAAGASEAPEDQAAQDQAEQEDDPAVAEVPDAATTPTAEAAPDARQAASGDARAEQSAERLMLQGRVQNGAECPVLETADGALYSLVSADYGFLPGEYVEIEGETVEMSFCMEGMATVRVTSMNAVPAPQGG